MKPFLKGYSFSHQHTWNTAQWIKRQELLQAFSVLVLPGLVNFLQSSKYGAVFWIYAEFSFENRDKLMKEQGPGRTFRPAEERAHTGAGLLAWFHFVIVLILLDFPLQLNFHELYALGAQLFSFPDLEPDKVASNWRVSKEWSQDPFSEH